MIWADWIFPAIYTTYLMSLNGRFCSDKAMIT